VKGAGGGNQLAPLLSLLYTLYTLLSALIHLHCIYFPFLFSPKLRSGFDERKSLIGIHLERRHRKPNKDNSPTVGVGYSATLGVVL
jgi:hypothetical protein